MGLTEIQKQTIAQRLRVELGRYRNFRYRYRYSDTSFQIPILQINASEILFHLVFTSQCKYHVKTIILELD
jgi:hypothetical protein